jgi:hypothetical protein
MASATETAASIRESLKKLGFTGRDISVRAESYLMGSTIHVRVINPRVSLAVARAVAARYEHVRRDDGTGEILGGGNRFVDVEHDRKTLAAAMAPVLDVVLALEVGQSAEVAGRIVGRLAENDFRVRLDDHVADQLCWGARHAARMLAELQLTEQGIHCRAVAVKVAA